MTKSQRATHPPLNMDGKRKKRAWQDLKASEKEQYRGLGIRREKLGLSQK